MTAPKPLHVIAFDPGFGHMGMAHLVVDGRPTNVQLLDVSAASTTKVPQTKRTTTHMGSDDRRRIEELVDAAFAFVYRAHARALPNVSAPPVRMIAAYEVAAGAQGFHAAKGLGIAHGMMIGFLRGDNSFDSQSILEVTAREAKAALTGDPKASKAHMISVARTRFASYVEWADTQPAYQLEHGADAIGVGLAALATPAGISIMHGEGIIRGYTSRARSAAPLPIRGIE